MGRDTMRASTRTSTQPKSAVGQRTWRRAGPHAHDEAAHHRRRERRRRRLRAAHARPAAAVARKSRSRGRGRGRRWPHRRAPRAGPARSTTAGVIRRPVADEVEGDGPLDGRDLGRSGAGARNLGALPPCPRLPLLLDVHLHLVRVIGLDHDADEPEPGEHDHEQRPGTEERVEPPAEGPGAEETTVWSAG